MKKIIIIAIAIVTLILIVIGVSVAYMFYLPSGCAEVHFRIGCAKISESNNVVWYEGALFGYKEVEEDAFFCRKLSATLKSLHLQKTNDVLDECELVQISLRDESYSELRTYYLAYDFALKDVFMQKGGEWYYVKNHDHLDEIITELIDIAGGRLAYNWKGQSTFAHEEFVESDFSKASFRYNLHWKSSKAPTVENHDVRVSGFNNTEPTLITSYDAAIKRAAQELGYSNYIGTGFYDKTCGYWMVEICPEPYNDMTVTEFTNYLYDHTYTVIMTEQGIICESYRSVTRFAPFIFQRYEEYAN